MTLSRPCKGWKKVEFANFVTIQDAEFTMPWWENNPPHPGDVAVYTKRYTAIDLPNVNTRKQAVLFWKMRNRFYFTMNFWFNGNLAAPMHHRTGKRLESYHETVSGAHLQEKNNELVIAVSDFPYMSFSDVILMYGASTPDSGPEVVQA